MRKRLGVVMDPIQSINYKKDSTLALLWKAEERGYELVYMEQDDLFVREGVVYANARALTVHRDPEKWFTLGAAHPLNLSELDILLMRKDPPFNRRYIYTTYLLELAEHQGVRVINKPQALRDANEKLLTTWFPDCAPLSVVASDLGVLKAFYAEQQDIVCKPLDAMGGASIFHLRPEDPNASVVFETLTRNGRQPVMAQRYIPEITQGDKRVLMIHGEPVPYALARVPQPGEWRGNLAAGAVGRAQPLSENDHRIALRVGPYLREKGLFFAGLDIIGDFLTEINVTSPTCIRELDAQCGMDIAGMFFDKLA